MLTLIMEANIHHHDDYLGTKSPPLEPVVPTLKPLASPDWLPLSPSRSPSPWKLPSVHSLLPHSRQKTDRKKRRKRHAADFNSRTPSPEKSSNPRGRKRYRKPQALQEDALLVDIMGGFNHPDIASRAGEEALPQSDDSDLEEMAHSRSVRRVDLPMLIQGTTIRSRPDSGSEDNIIAVDVVSAFDLKMDTAPEHCKEFRVANRRSVWALGRIVIDCTFAKDRTLELCCTFYVFQNLTSKLIMGMPFLDETQTLVKYQYRFQPRIVPTFRPIQLSSLSSPRRRLYCLVDPHPKLANADTGSEIDLMSLEYVIKRGFSMTAVGLSSSTVQFADGSTSELVGKMSVLIVLGTPEGFRNFTTFYVLDGLTSDVLLGEDFLSWTRRQRSRPIAMPFRLWIATILLLRSTESYGFTQRSHIFLGEWTHRP